MSGRGGRGKPARRCATCAHRVKRYRCQHRAEWCALAGNLCIVARFKGNYCAGHYWTPKSTPGDEVKRGG